MTGERIDQNLFDYVDEHASSIERGDVEEDEGFDPDWQIFTFCQLFFDQFFGQFGTNIRGFTQRSREAAAQLIESMRAAGQAGAPVREIVVLYEEFCDMNDNTSKGYGAPAPITARMFHNDYLVRLLETSRDWAVSEGATSLGQRIDKSLDRYRTAARAAQWEN